MQYQTPLERVSAVVISELAHSRPCLEVSEKTFFSEDLGLTVGMKFRLFGVIEEWLDIKIPHKKARMMFTVGDVATYVGGAISAKMRAVAFERPVQRTRCSRNGLTGFVPR